MKGLARCLSILVAMAPGIVQGDPRRFATDPGTVSPRRTATVAVVSPTPIPRDARFVLSANGKLTSTDRLSDTVTLIGVETGDPGLILIDCQLGGDVLFGRGLIECSTLAVELAVTRLALIVGTTQPESTLLVQISSRWEAIRIALLADRLSTIHGHRTSALEILDTLTREMARHDLLTVEAEGLLSTIRLVFLGVPDDPQKQKKPPPDPCKVVMLTPEGPTKVIISTLPDDPGLPKYPDPKQTVDQKILITAVIAPPKKGETVFFWINDPPDKSPYTRGTVGDNLGGLGSLTRAPTYDGDGPGTTIKVTTKEDGKAEAILTITDTHAGDNYIIKAKCRAKDEAHPDKATKPLVAWRREYLELDRMYRTGGLLRSIEAIAGMPNFRLRVHRGHTPTYGVAEAAPGSRIRVFDAYDQVGQLCDVLAVVAPAGPDDDVELRVAPRLEPGQAAVKDLSRYIPGIGITGEIGGGAAFVPENDRGKFLAAGSEFLELAFAGSVEGTDGSAFTEFKVLRQGFVPRVDRYTPSASSSALTRRLARERFGWLWFEETRDKTTNKALATPALRALFAKRLLRIVHVVSARATQEGTAAGITSRATIEEAKEEPWRKPVAGGTAVVAGRVVCTSSYVAVELAERADVTPVQRLSIARETLVHEVSHHWFPNNQDTREEHENEPNWKGAGTHCIADNRAASGDTIKVFGDGEAEFATADLLTGNRPLRSNGRIR